MPGETQADAVDDLRTKGNALSVFEVDDPANVERIVVAFASGRMNPDHIGFAVFDGDAVGRLGIQIQKTPGSTADAAVNALHHDLQQLTASQLAGLANIVAGGTTDQILRKRLTELLKDGLAAGRLDQDKVNPKLLSQL